MLGDVFPPQTDFYYSPVLLQLMNNKTCQKTTYINLVRRWQPKLNSEPTVNYSLCENKVSFCLPTKTTTLHWERRVCTWYKQWELSLLEHFYSIYFTYLILQLLTFIFYYIILLFLSNFVISFKDYNFVWQSRIIHKHCSLFQC